MYMWLFVHCSFITRHYLFLKVSQEIRLFTLCTLCVWVCLKHVALAYPQQHYKRPKVQIPTDISKELDNSDTASPKHRSTMKAWFVLLLLLPLCMGKSETACISCLINHIRSFAVRWRNFVAELAENRWNDVDFYSISWFFSCTLSFFILLRQVYLKYCMLL